MSSVQTSRIAPAAGGGAGEPLRHFAPAPIIGGLPLLLGAAASRRDDGEVQPITSY